MPFSEINRQRYDELNHPDRCEGLWPRDQERAWFTGDAENIVGVLLEDSNKGYWSYMLCVRSDKGGYRRVGLGADIPSERFSPPSNRQRDGRL